MTSSFLSPPLPQTPFPWNCFPFSCRGEERLGPHPPPYSHWMDLDCCPLVTAIIERRGRRESMLHMLIYSEELGGGEG